MLIINRISTGSGWTSETTERISAFEEGPLIFAPPTPTKSKLHSSSLESFGKLTRLTTHENLSKLDFGIGFDLGGESRVSLSRSERSREPKKVPRKEVCIDVGAGIDIGQLTKSGLGLGEDGVGYLGRYVSKEVANVDPTRPDEKAKHDSDEQRKKQRESIQSIMSCSEPSIYSCDRSCHNVK